MLTLKNVTKTFGAKVAVDDVSFTVKPGEVYALIGPNSSGKTTIVRSIAGILRPNKGVIEVGGTSVLADPILTKAQLGYIPDEPVAWSGMTGEEFLHFSGALYGLSPEKRTTRIAELLPLFALEGVAKDYFDSYSRGNKQKFSILAALLHEPKLLLIDEPIVGLDPESAEVARKEFAAFAKAGGTVLLVTHTLSVAEAIANTIGLLKDGKLIASGAIAELRTRAGLSSSAPLDEVYAALAH